MTKLISNLTRQQIGLLQILLSGVCYGFLGIFGRLAFNNLLTVEELITYRFSLSFLILFAVLAIFKKDLLKISKQQFFISIGLGAIGYAIFATFYFKAIEQLAVPLAALILFTFPIFVNLGSFFFLKEKLSKYQIISLIITSVGLIILILNKIDFSLHATSIIYALTAAVLYSAYILVSGVYQKEIAPLTSTVYVLFSSAVMLWCLNFKTIKSITEISINQFLVILGISVISTILPISLFLSGLQKIKSSKASILVTVEPLTAAIASYFILGESLSGLQFIGGVLILIGIVVDAKYK